MSSRLLSIRGRAKQCKHPKQANLRILRILFNATPSSLLQLFPAALSMAATGTSTSRESTELANASTPRSTKPSNKRTASEVNTNTPVKSARRKHDDTSTAPSRPTDVVDLTGEHVAITTTTPTKKPKTPRKKKDPDEPVPERRARVFRNHPPKTYLDRLARARSQRLDSFFFI